MKVLLLADQCNPEWPSLPIVGYKAAKALAELVEITLVTQIRNRENIDKNPIPGVEVAYIDNEYIAAPLYIGLTKLRGGNEGSWTTVMAADYPVYLAFERSVWKRFGPALKAGEYDVVHRITPMSPTLPSYLATKSPVPFVMGPLNGGLRWPREFLAEMRKEKEWLAPIRDFYKVLPYNRAGYHHASAILASFEHTIAEVPPRDRGRTIDFPEVGIDPDLFNVTEPRPRRERREVLYAGRFVPYKLPDLVVRAFAESDVLKRHRLIMVGDGPMRPELEQIVRDRGIEDSVEFVGWKTQKEVGELMRSADIFAFPSMRELGAGVVVEAMACGLVSAVLDYGAPGTLVDDGSGITVPLGTRAETASGFRRALETLVQTEDLEPHSRHAQARALDLFSWRRKAKKTLEVYEWVLGRGERPEFWPPREEHGLSFGQAAARP